MDPILLLKISGEGGFIEIYQEGNGYVYHSDESSLKELLSDEDAEDIEFDFRKGFSSLKDALLCINIGLLERGTITYVDSEKAFDIKLMIQRRIQNK